MTRILVTGGAGFIGSHIADVFLQEGHEVDIIDDLSSGSMENVPERAMFHRGDIRDNGVRSLLNERSPEVIVHCAAQISVRASMEDPRLDTEINVVGLVNLLQAYLGKPTPHFVFISTGGAIYGDQDVYPAPEDHPVRPASVYGLAKRVGELYLDLWTRQMELSFTSLRLANVYGPRQNPHGEAGVVAIFSQKLLRGQVPTINGTGKQTRDFVFVKDVAEAVRLVAAKRVQGIFNIGTGRETSVVEVYEMIAKSLGKDIRPNFGPAKSGEQMRSSIDAGLAARTFGWTPKVTIEEGLEETAKWFAKGG